MELIELNATVRDIKDNGSARALRRNALLPAVLYGPNTKSVPLTIQMTDFEKILKANPVGQVLFKLKVKDSKVATQPTMVKELQVHPVSQQYLHADFYEIDMDRKIRVKVPVTATGNSVGVEIGGLLQIIRHELEVLCLPLRIPETIELDVTDLSIGDAIHVEDISLDDDIEIIADTNFTVLTVGSPKVEEEEEEEAEEEVEGEEGAEDEASEDEAAEGSDDD